MVLIADSGSTKCDWQVYNKMGDMVFQKSTNGINPMIHSDDDILLVLQELKNDILIEISQIEFYCAGGKNEESQQRLTRVFHQLFKRAQVRIEDDLGMAVKCTKGVPGVVCILGTGSNSCFFDGTKIHKRLPDLGYQVMDLGSGNYFGRELLRSYAYGYMPHDLMEKFGNRYDLESKVILQELYRGENPSSYLANFARFMIENHEHPFHLAMIEKGMEKVFDYVLRPYQYEIKRHPLYFIGSIAFHLQDHLREKAKVQGYEAIHFIDKPIKYLSVASQM
ncbi:N-acetylglucosamine kinase [Muricauda sp. TY007]|uniref:N-acetylglucosamine kinase n=1 Tax=Allomuricauda sp. TY007 TaxID=2683200 RepID=UPI0013BEF347|nr:N-acetylglucosamine kinase [Muricauda sp. TY007]NDV16567.1 N-acetylglucosamine kinase [Muricauda sp. TY007]